MSTRRGWSIPASAAALSARHPRAALLAALVVAALSVVMLGRLNISGSMAAMLGESTPSAAAMQRISTNYRAGDELLVLVEPIVVQAAGLHADSPQAPSSDSYASLTEFAQRLERELAADPDFAPLVHAFHFRRDSAFVQFAREVMLPAGPYYFSDAGFESFLERLTPRGMADQIARTQTLIAAPAPAGGALSASALRDPLNLAELLPAALRDRAQGFAGSPASANGPAAEDPPERSLDGRALLIRIAGARPVSDLTFAAALVDAVEECSRRAAPDGLRVGIGGGYAIAATSSRMIRALQ